MLGILFVLSLIKNNTFRPLCVTKDAILGAVTGLCLASLMNFIMPGGAGGRNYLAEDHPEGVLLWAQSPGWALRYGAAVGICYMV